VDGGGLAATVRLELVAHALVFVERGHAGAQNRTDVDERIGGAVVGGDESVALVGVEEFDGADQHGSVFHDLGIPQATAQRSQEA